MAVLSKIRERSMFLIIIIGLALFAFVLDPSTLGDFFNSNKVNEIGEINGETISRQEFATAVEQYRKQVGSRVSEMQATKTVWDNIVRKKIYQNQLAEAGITVGEADVWNEIINTSSVKNNPQFLNEVGLFDERKFKQFLATEKEKKSQLWGAWSNYMNQIRDNSERNTYNNLVAAGLGASLKEGETAYFIENTKLNSQFVFVPYSTIADSLVTISKSEIEAYVKANPETFKVEESRDISYVKFDIIATPEDEEVIKKNITTLIEDFKSATNEEEFLNENNSDLNLDLSIKVENGVNKTVASEIFKGSKGDVFGPYKDQGYIKLSKIVEVTKMPGSVKASHILIPFVGSQRATSDITRTQEQAKKLADSILNAADRDNRMFAVLAKKYSSDKLNSEKGGDLDWFGYDKMSPAFRDFCFTDEIGIMNVVQTPFGFHVIKIDDQKNFKKALKLATYGRKIIASEATENAIFQKAEQFALAVTNNKNFLEVVKENKYTAKPAIGLKVLDENVPGLGNQRDIVRWSFGTNRETGDFKRFDLEGSHVVAFLSNKTEKGLMSASKATNRVRPILLNEKKAKLIAGKLKGDTLEDIAKANNTTVKTSNGVTLKSPTLSGAGSEPKIVGAMYNAELNKLHNNIDGNRGVYAFKVLKKELPTALPNYETTRKKISEARKRLTFKMYEAIKKASDIKDNRANFYSSN
jgi:peptidylprolyl isomerase/peptidyl-prolyl cis-trans isomerase D